MLKAVLVSARRCCSTATPRFSTPGALLPWGTTPCPARCRRAGPRARSAHPPCVLVDDPAALGALAEAVAADAGSVG